ncbi:hypothetical protein BD626DRAFT_261517 [Schizophyllum amplum]|uniref:Uncharacterized protein n=1 Tax=Schizophyllum amplum TaxID=97359 RepID=A0A550CGB3_9AGAR|nr:hypothetical protein BD626DRAFT_261517 [Auriculariopsis ampla]
MADPSLPEPSSQAMDTSPDFNQETTSFAVDPSSLRAAALMTLKSKRRKPAEVAAPPSLPARPQGPSDTLDYGSSEPAPPPESSAPASDPGQREEGEISDSEEPPAPAQAPEPPQPLPQRPRPAALPPKPAFLDTTPIPVKPAEPPTPSLLDRISTAPRKASGSFSSQISPREKPPRRPSIITMPVHEPEFVIDAEHIRPGLTMTQEQYDTAKDIILDLLGWGVHPNHLLDMGLSREILFYVFSELNLRFPANLDATGLIPYTPNMVRPGTHSELPAQRGLHHGLPPKPPPLATPVRPIQQTLDPDVPPSAALLDMEQKRRQELMARKRKTATLKAQQSHRTQDIEMGPPAPIDQVEDFLQSIAPGPSGPLSAQPSFSSLSAQATQSPPSYADDDMDVDEIPGLSFSRPEPPPPVRPAPAAVPKPAAPVMRRQAPPPAPAPASAPVPRQAPAAAPVPAAPAATPRAPVPAVAPTPAPAAPMPVPKEVGLAPSLSQVMAAALPGGDIPRVDEVPAMPASASYNGNGFNASSAQKNGQTRNGQPPPPPRGKKRPVAADFVDADERRPAPRPQMPRSPVRANSFAGGISTAKRLIIDVSDTEDDGSSSIGTSSQGSLSMSQSVPYIAQPMPTLPLTMTGTPITGMPMYTKGFGTPTAGLGSPRPPAAGSPAALVGPDELRRKEDEIRRMKQKIIDAEKRKKQPKLVPVQVGDSAVTTPTSGSTVVSPVVAPAVVASMQAVVAPKRAVGTPKPTTAKAEVARTPRPAVPMKSLQDSPRPNMVLQASAPAFHPAKPLTPAATPKPVAVVNHGIPPPPATVNDDTRAQETLQATAKPDELAARVPVLVNASS